MLRKGEGKMQVRSRAKLFVTKSGVRYPLTQLKSLFETFHWLRAGCSGAAPHPIKVRVIKSYMKNRAMDRFIETGTYLGDTLSRIAKSGIRCASIELSQELYEAAVDRFRRYNNVRLVQGDSGQKLPELLAEIDKPTLFWLDGHYSSGITARGRTQTPISAELQAILGHPIKQHIVLIDDARCFNGTNDYPHLDDLLRKIRDDGNYSVEVSTDIIRLVPRVAS